MRWRKSSSTVSDIRLCYSSSEGRGYHSIIHVPKELKRARKIRNQAGKEERLSISIMERHHQHTSPFPPEFRTTHNFYTKEVFVMPLHPNYFLHGVERGMKGTERESRLLD